jgi:hypothetical protein
MVSGACGRILGKEGVDFRLAVSFSGSNFAKNGIKGYKFLM